MRLIGIAGRAGSGKDTVADYLVRDLGFVKYSLANPIKKMLDAIGVDCRTRETKEIPHPVFGVSPRRMAQMLGTEWMRVNVSPMGWLLLAEEFIKTTSALNTFDDVPLVNGVVIPDIRFENEASWLRNQGGSILHVARNVDLVESHISEAGVEIRDGDRVIQNNESMGSLYERIAAVFMEDKSETDRI